MRFSILDVSYETMSGRTYIRIHPKPIGGGERRPLYFEYDPYFYAIPEGNEKEAEKRIMNIRVSNGERMISPKKTESVEKTLGIEKVKAIKVYVKEPRDVPILSEAVPYRCHEYNIPFSKRFLADFDLDPISVFEGDVEERNGHLFLKDIRKIRELETYALSQYSFDIETYNPYGAPRPSKDKIILVSRYSKNGGKVFSLKKSGKEFVQAYETEKEMLEGFFSDIASEDPDILYGYNSANFDIPYIIERSKRTGIKTVLGTEEGIRKVRKGRYGGAQVKGRVHMDLYPIMRFLAFIGVINAKRFTLEAVYSSVLDQKKMMVERKDIWKMWDKGDISELLEYSLFDSRATYELGSYVLPIYVELSNLCGMTLFDASLSTAGQLVETLLIRRCARENIIVPNTPSHFEVEKRMADPIEGAFVRVPDPGIYENIAVLDFRGLYPSIIVSYNVDPSTITENEDEAYISPKGWKFRKSPKGIIPRVLEELIDVRTEVKKQMKNERDPERKKLLSARSQSLKILANSFYGYLLYARSRWYDRRCGESVTAWGREHIRNTMKKAEEWGFKVIYGDTDSLFLLMNGKGREEVLRFLDSVNSELPGKMELELEGFYKTGVFVGKKSEESGAKKKYALLSEDGSIKIRGFELVRRDWSGIAKETQKKVLETILKERDKEKAADIVRRVIRELKEGKVPIKDLTIYTQITKDPKNYDVLSPEISAARKLIEMGRKVPKGSIIGYVIGKKGKSISEKAVPAEFAKEYDHEYYVNNQILPAVMKILKELGYREDDLKLGGKQTSLGQF